MSKLPLRLALKSLKIIIFLVLSIGILTGGFLVGRSTNLLPKIDPASATLLIATLPGKFVNALIGNSYQIAAAAASPYQSISSNVYINGKLGIGTSTPSYPLVISNGSTYGNTFFPAQGLGYGEPTAAGTGSDGDKVLFLNSGIAKTGFGADAQNGLWVQGSAGSTYPAFRIFDGASGAAPTQLVTVLGNGNVGIGTTSPQQALHVVGKGYFQGTNGIYIDPNIGGTNNAVISTDTSQNLQLRSGSSTLMTLLTGGNVGIGTTNPGDKLEIASAGKIRLDNTANSNWALIYPSSTQGSGYADLNLAGGSGNGIFIQNGGNVGIGNTNPTSKLQVNDGNTRFGLSDGWLEMRRIGTEAQALAFRIINNAYNQGWDFNMPSSSNDLQITNISCCVQMTLADTGGVAIRDTADHGYTLYVNGSLYYASGGLSGSDLRLKKNIEPLTGVLGKLDDINSVKFDWRTNEFPQRNLPKGRQIGLIAQDVEKQFPELVNTDNEGYKALDYGKFGAVLLEAIKEQQKEIEDLKQEVKQLKAK
ncbi:MAG: tail fiber domain-containing protein [Patescibacteria group bacterium]|nr:tail fiber domain-containing protein [Patescibacteria group bacterium]